MSRTSMNRILWFLQFMLRHPSGATKQEIDEAWSNYDLSEKIMSSNEIPRTTFNRLIQTIWEVFGISIECYGRIWRINDDEIKLSESKQRMLDTLSIFSTVNVNEELNNHIMIEKLPSGNEFLENLLQAILKKQIVKIYYWGFEEDDLCGTWEILSYGLRVFDRRWYVIGAWSQKTVDKMLEYEMAEGYEEDVDWERVGKIRKVKYAILPLDRIKEIEILPDKYEIPKDFDIDGIFHDFIGPYIDDEIPMEKIVVEAFGRTALYFETLPIHHSQKKIEEKEYADDYSTIFEFNLRPTRYFYRELLKYGSDIKVISPDCIKNEIQREAEKMMARYSSTNS